MTLRRNDAGQGSDSRERALRRGLIEFTRVRLYDRILSN